jgi:protein required for attachment to host cells
MSEQDFTWIVTADGERARVFEERVHAGPLHELADRAIHQSDHDRAHAVHPKATAGGNFGSGRHNVNENDPHAKAKDVFLHRVAEMLDKAADGHAFAHLILVAPPKALGDLKAALKPSTLRRVQMTDPHERTGENADTLRASIRKLRTY